MKTIYTFLAALTLISCGAPEPVVVEEAPAPTLEYLDAAAAASLIDSEEVKIVDVRTPAEFANGHLVGATNIDFNSAAFADEVAKLDPESAYLIHCAVGGRSTASLETFEAAGFKRLYHLDGGYNGWVDAGLPTE